MILIFYFQKYIRLLTIKIKVMKLDFDNLLKRFEASL